MKKLLVIIPAYNEEGNILNTVKSVRSVQSDICLIDYVVINDCSLDNTKNVCLENNLNFIDLPINLGIGGAVQTGYKYALYNGYDYALQFDGDGQHDASFIEKMILEIEKGTDMVIGSRFVSELSEFKSTKVRRVGIKFLSFLIKIFTGRKIYDTTSGFRLVNRNLIEQFASNYPIDYPEPDTLVTIIRNGYKVVEIPVKMNERTSGVSSINFIKSIYYMIKVSLAIVIAGVSTKKVGVKSEK